MIMEMRIFTESASIFSLLDLIYNDINNDTFNYHKLKGNNCKGKSRFFCQNVENLPLAISEFVLIKNDKRKNYAEILLKI